MPTQSGAQSILLAGSDTHKWEVRLDSQSGHSLSITGAGGKKGTSKVLSVAAGELTHIVVDFKYNSGGEAVTVYVNGKSLASSDTDSTTTGNDWADKAVFKLGDCLDPSKCPNPSVSAFRVLTYARTGTVPTSAFEALYDRAGAVPFAHAKHTAPQMCLRPIKAPEFTFNFGTETKVSSFKIT